MKLEEFLARELVGSTLRINSGNDDEFLLESDPVIRVHVALDRKTKKIEFDLYSPRWSRKINVEEPRWFYFHGDPRRRFIVPRRRGVDLRGHAACPGSVHESWAKINKYEVSEIEPDVS